VTGEPKNDVTRIIKEWISVTSKLDINKNTTRIIEQMAPGMQLLSDARIGAFVFDYARANYLYFNNHFARMMNMTHEKILQHGFAIMQKNVHAEDFLKCLNITMKSQLEFKKMKDHEATSFSLRLFYRLKVGKDQYAWMMQSNMHVKQKEGEERIDIGYIIELFDSQQPIKVMGIMETNNRRMVLYPDGEMDLLSSLSLRELEVLQLIKHGLGSKEVAEKLTITEHTVKAHRRNLLRKLKVRNMVQAVGMLDKI